MTPKQVDKTCLFRPEFSLPPKRCLKLRTVAGMNLSRLPLSPAKRALGPPFGMLSLASPIITAIKGSIKGELGVN